MRFHISIMKPGGPGNFYTQAFHEVVETLAYGLVALGHQVSYKTNGFLRGAQNIVLGPQFADDKTEFPDGTILYNLEQIGGSPAMLMSPTLSKRYVIWDYSPSNMTYWKLHGIEALCVPIGYVRELTRIKPVARPDIDVLFYGSINARRAKVLGELQARLPGKVTVMQGFGKIRDEAIARSKVILNIHYYVTPKLFEWVRISYLLSNMKAVVSEVSDDFPTELVGAMCVADYDKLAECCLDLLADTELRLTLQENGFRMFSKIREVDLLRDALCKSCESSVSV